MKEEQLDKANSIKQMLNSLAIFRKRWAESLKISELRGYTGDNYVDLNFRYIDFEVLKTLALSKINKEIEALEKEFAEL